MLTIREVRATANPGLRIEGVVLTMYDGRNNLSQQVEADARATLGDLVCRTVIPRNVRVSEAPSFALPSRSMTVHRAGPSPTATLLPKLPPATGSTSRPRVSNERPQADDQGIGAWTLGADGRCERGARCAGRRSPSSGYPPSDRNTGAQPRAAPSDILA